MSRGVSASKNHALCFLSLQTDVLRSSALIYGCSLWERKPWPSPWHSCSVWVRREDVEGILWSRNGMGSSQPIIGTSGNTRVSGSSACERTCSNFWDKPFTCNSLPGLTLGLWIPGLSCECLYLPWPVLSIVTKRLSWEVGMKTALVWWFWGWIEGFGVEACKLRVDACYLAAHFLTRTLLKPILRVQPDSVVSKHTNVTLLCEGARGAKQYHLYKLGCPYSCPMNSKIPLEPGNKVEFSISKVESHHAGLYRCYYTTQVGWSEGSETQELVVTGESTFMIPSSRFDCQEICLLSVAPSPTSKPWRILGPEDI